jgi:hypothetical protein
VELDHIALAHKFEQLLHIAIAHPDATVRREVANRARLIRAVNAVALQVEPDPPRSKRILRTRRDHHAGGVVCRRGQPPNDAEFPRWAWAIEGACCYRVDLYDAAVLDERQLAVRNAHNDPAHGLIVRLCGELGALLPSGLRHCFCCAQEK